MCFSAGASFTAAAVLGTAGVISVSQVKDKKQLLFASVPLLFSVQQCVEGMLWIKLTGKGDPATIRYLTFAFLFFSQLLWTSWLPLSFFFLEKEEKRIKWLRVVTIIGMASSVLMLYRLLFHDAYAEILEHHIHYALPFPDSVIVVYSILYVIAIIAPAFVSGIKHSTVVGILLSLTLIVSKIGYAYFLTSVWCFFASFVSIAVIWIMRELRKEQE